jgi:hypothetical protein
LTSMFRKDKVWFAMTGANHAAVQIPYGDDGEGMRSCNVFAAQSLMPLANSGPFNQFEVRPLLLVRVLVPRGSVLL